MEGETYLIKMARNLQQKLTFEAKSQEIGRKRYFQCSTGAICGTTIMKGLERFEITYACTMFHSPKMVATVSSPNSVTS